MVKRPIFGLILAACGGSGVPAVVPPTSHPCLVAAVDTPVRDTISVALAAPEAVRFMSAHLSDSAAIDCGGRATSFKRGTFRTAPGNTLLLLPPDSTGPVIRIEPLGATSDLRDQIDRQVDVVITSDPAVIEYARGRGDRRLVPLAWSITYVLAAGPDQPVPVEPTDALRQQLATEVVRAQARPAGSLAWWTPETGCTVAPARFEARLPGLVIPERDPIARALGERLVALDPERRRLTSLPTPELFLALTQARATAFIIPLPSHAGSCQAGYRIPRNARILPLVEVRETAILRAGVPSFFLVGDGTIRFPPLLP